MKALWFVWSFICYSLVIGAALFVVALILILLKYVCGVHFPQIFN